MTEEQSFYSRDLAGVFVGDTAISDVDGEAGLLSYRGIDINDLVGVPYLHVVWMVLFGEWPNEQQKSRLKAFMCKHSRLSHSEIDLLQQVPRDLHPMLMLQGMVPLLTPPTEQLLGMGEDAETGLFLAAKITGLVAAHYRLGQSKVILPPTPGKLFHENFLTMFHGKAPTADQQRMLDAAQILQIEHSFNASTFVARACASTLAPVENALSAAFGTLHGVLHGGADQAALETADQVGSPDKAAAFVDECLATKTKVMGMGHREYKVLDPRARYLKALAADLCAGTDHEQTYQTLVAIEDRFIERMAEDGKALYANLEFYKGVIYRTLGIPTPFFTANFALARVYGYLAHFMESRQDNRLVRPKALYTGRTVSAPTSTAA